MLQKPWTQMIHCLPACVMKASLSLVKALTCHAIDSARRLQTAWNLKCTGTEQPGYIQNQTAFQCWSLHSLV